MKLNVESPEITIVYNYYAKNMYKKRKEKIINHKIKFRWLLLHRNSTCVQKFHLLFHQVVAFNIWNLQQWNVTLLIKEVSDNFENPHWISPLLIIFFNMYVLCAMLLKTYV